jgi:sugar/nucleoside kinase (ribokinase family)
MADMQAICIGSAMVDIIVLVASRDVERMTMTNATSSFLLLEQGRKIESESITTHIGGGAINAAVSMTRLGVAATPLIKIGEDRYAGRILERLADESVDQSAVLRTAEAPSGTAVMVSSHDRNATIFTQRGANTLLRPDDLEEAMFTGRDLVYVTNLSNQSADCFPLVVNAGAKAGAFVAVNPGIRQLSSRTAAFLGCLKQMDLLAINRVEAEALVPSLAAMSVSEGDAARKYTSAEDDPRLMRIGLSFGGFDMDLVNFFLNIRGQGVHNMLITDGIEGSYLADDTGIHYCPSLRVEVKGTAGAGDAFISTLCAMLAGGKSVEEAMRSAAINAASVASEIDTQGGLLSAETLAGRLAESADQLPMTFWSWAELEA